jgi:hypothetical protein
MAIDCTNCMELILQEFPAFQQRWDEHLATWTPVIARPLALDIAEFSDFALELIQTGTDAEIDRLAILTEQILADGDSIVNYTFRMMFLKNIAKHSETNGIPLDRFTVKLLPIALYYCHALDIFWGDNLPVFMPDKDIET